jgi:hypothetical protein
MAPEERVMIDEWAPPSVERICREEIVYLGSKKDGAYLSKEDIVVIQNR